jgi:hypothetical protein
VIMARARDLLFSLRLVGKIKDCRQKQTMARTA